MDGLLLVIVTQIECMIIFQLQCAYRFSFVSSLCQTAIFSVADHAYSALALVPSDFLTSMAQTMPHIRSLRSLQNNKEGVEQWRERSSLRGWQTDSEPACPLSSDRQTSSLPAWPAADQGRARRLLKWRNLRAPQGVSWSFDVQHKGRGCDAEWAEGERQPLQSVTKTRPDG